jgi:DNA (cytosine-5)-methyltransferase 1
MSKKEGARLQSLEDIEMPTSETIAFKALGNAVNSKIVYLIAKNLFYNNGVSYMDYTPTYEFSAIP